MTDKLEILKQEFLGRTGHWSFHVRMIGQDEGGNTITGPESIYGISGSALEGTWGGDLEAWLVGKVKPKVKRDFDSMKAARKQAKQLKGKKL